MKQKFKSFKGKQRIKDKYVDRVKKHKEADEIIKGIYWQDGKGCAVGCTIRGSDHERYETELGIPQEIAYLEDTIFEGLPNGRAKEFPLEFLEAIPVGKDLSKVTLKFKIWLQKQNLERMKEESKKNKNLKDVYEEVISAIEGVIHVHEAELETGKKDKSAAWSAWSAAGSAVRSAWSAAWSAAGSAARSAWSAAWSAAESAAESAAWSAWSAERSAERSAWSATRSAAYEDMADKLIQLLKEVE